ncbi:hypothetical protein E2C01_023565 [Portunus trituberculatus]|uniref:Uncharacterized protein n=1 Tax=Portunus trituberculatus TaxID=210409 RepID=A0A5B7EBX0_PORTR|nr:hypothetical protein [Portunus trituberculatus]
MSPGEHFYSEAFSSDDSEYKELLECSLIYWLLVWSSPVPELILMPENVCKSEKVIPHPTPPNHQWQTHSTSKITPQTTPALTAHSTLQTPASIDK